MTRKLILTLLLAMTTATLWARPPRVRIEWGVLGGVNIADYSTNMGDIDVKDRLGWQVGIMTAVNWGAVALEPQILFVRQGLKIRPEGVEQIRLRSHSIEIPVLASLRILKPLRFYLGPVFTVMNDCKDKQGDNLIDFGRVRPTVSFAGGLGIQLNRHMLIDLRYNGQLRSKHNVALPDGRMIDKMRMFNVAFSFGYIF